MENIEQLIEYIETFQDEENWSNDVWSIKIAAIRLKEEQNRKAAMLNPDNLDDVLTKQDRGVCKDCYYAGSFTCEH